MIRIATQADVPAILEIYAPYVLTTTYTFEYDVPTQEEFLARFRSITERFPWLVWEEDGRILGYAYGSAPFERAAYRWLAEDSVYLRPEARGRGIGAKLLQALEDILRYQGYGMIYAIITSENQNSLEFHRKMGYSFLAEFPDCAIKFQKRLGIIWMDKVLRYVDLSSNFPTPFREIMQDRQKICDILGILSLF
jgi:phosphinothricin acetyltransferase